MFLCGCQGHRVKSSEGLTGTDKQEPLGSGFLCQGSRKAGGGRGGCGGAQSKGL